MLDAALASQWSLKETVLLSIHLSFINSKNIDIGFVAGTGLGYTMQLTKQWWDELNRAWLQLLLSAES